MSTTPVSSGYSVDAPVTTNRNGSQAALEILQDMDFQDYEPLSPETDAYWDKCRAKAMQAVDYPESDAGDLEDRWKLTKKLVETKIAAKKDTEAHERKNAKLEQRLQRSTDDSNRTRRLMLEGDWIASLHNIMKSAEIAARHKFNQSYQNALKAKGLSGKDAREEMEKSSEFFAIHGFQVSQTLAHVEPELDAIKRWRTEGEKVGREPPTPYLDRIGATCKVVGITRSFYLSRIRAYHERNELAHHPTPFDRCLRSDGTMDWKAVRKGCLAAKAKTRRLFKNGKYTEAQKDAFIETINTWLNLHIKAVGTKGSVPTPLGRDAAARAQDGIRKRAMKNKDKVPDSPWTEGKWDDLE